ncbi:MAG: DUF6597 domain-containing transcriptional factor [Acidimicrobiales bacterium]
MNWPDEKDTRGIVSPSLAASRFTLDRFDPAPPLDRFVGRFWKTTWNLDEPFVQSIVTFPVVNLVFQADGSAVVSGVQLENDERCLEGSGWALGVMFRVGGFSPFSSAPMADLVGERIPAAELFGPSVGELAAAVSSAADSAQQIALVSTFLAARVPDHPTPGEQLSDWVERAVSHEPPVTKVGDLALLAACSTRTLQRLFREHVGVGAKLVLDRHRIQAAGEAARKPVSSWLDVAADLGYADQAHLTAAMTDAFGQPPARYARQES